jgi:UDP-N-acetylmuramate--alanine ligase
MVESGDAWSARLREPAPVHFIGVGGVGMAGLARLLRQAGFPVSGSDLSPGSLGEDLRDLGARVFAGHHAGHVPPETAWVVRTPAVAPDNPELEAARARHLPVFARGDVLAAISRSRPSLAVAGAHGKTTTSAMLAHVLRACGIDAGYAIGGETSLPGKIADTGMDPHFVCEADESDGTLVAYTAEVGILTHVEWDHIEHFRSMESLLDCYRRFAFRCRTLWIRGDDPLAARVAEGHPRVRRAGESEGADLRLLSAEDDPQGQTIRLAESVGRLPLPGRHNAWNALLALGAAGELGVAPARGLAALASFVSVGRRFDRVEVGGITLVSDYAHHPTEIRALLDSARALGPRRIRVAFQPHRYSRTRHLLDEFARCFAGVAELHLLPVYAASERPSQGVGSDALARACDPFVPTRLHADAEALAAAVLPGFCNGDVFLIVGAGDIVRMLPMLREKLMKKRDVTHGQTLP